MNSQKEKLTVGTPSFSDNSLEVTLSEKIFILGIDIKDLLEDKTRSVSEKTPL